MTISRRPWRELRDPRANDVHHPICGPVSLPLSGANSLASNSGREGWDVTLYAGFRPWRGGEIWINPEIDQGFALSDFHGVAGFVNNDPSKGSSYPFARIQRAFFQQTIDLGGEVQKVDARPQPVRHDRD